MSLTGSSATMDTPPSSAVHVFEAIVIVQSFGEEPNSLVNVMELLYALS